MTDKPMQRFKVPLYVLAECEGVDEGDAADRASAALYNLNLPPYFKVELRPGTPMPPQDDGRLFIRTAVHLGTAALNGYLSLTRGKDRP
jgi:hypothetical protein